jgi:hypothetical protein
MKLADFGATMDEGLRDPCMMTGPWKHSGARIYWDHTSKGRIVRPVLERLLVEIRISRADPFYHRREGNLPPGLIGCLRDVLGWSFDIADLYTAQNLAILAAEYGLPPQRRQRLVDHFLDHRMARDASGPLFDELLDERALDPEVCRKGLAATHRLVPNEAPVRDLTRLCEYCAAARWRARVREEFGLPPCPPATVAEVTQHFETGASGLK